MEKTKLPTSLLEHIPWENTPNPIWPATAFLLKRNLARNYFPPKMNESQSKQTMDLLEKNLLPQSLLIKPLLLKAENLSPLDKEFLFEHFLCQESFQNTLTGQGFVIDDTSRFIAMLNIDDHLQLQLMECKGDWENAWNTLSKIEFDLANTLEFAHSPRFGYLTSNPSYCGTGLLVMVYLHLPALIHTGQLQETLQKSLEEETTAAGIQGDLQSLVGDIVVLKNQYTLGITEENILHSLHTATMKLMALEKALRTHLASENNEVIKDDISRAYGLLVHSYQLQTKEALDALSMMKLGVDLGWVQGISDPKLNELFFKCRRGHLTHLYQEKAIDQQDIGRKRAEFLHSQLKEATLKI